MSGHGKGNAKKVVIAALAGNLGIAAAKFFAAWLSGSAAMLAEGVHSFADTGNQALLLLGMTLAKRERPDLYQFGREKESYFWAFIVALLLFFLGGVFAVYEGAHRLLSAHGEQPGSAWVPLGILLVSLLMEGGSFFVAFREFNKERAGRSLSEALFRGKDPTIVIVLLEDTAAMAGLTIAFVAIGISSLTRSTIADALGSILIGFVLCGVGFLLARDIKSLLLGEGITAEMRAEVSALAESTPGVLKVTQLLSMHLGPDAIVLALKVRVDPNTTVQTLEKMIDDLEERVRGKYPEMKQIFVEPDSDYDVRLDPRLSMLPR